MSRIIITGANGQDGSYMAEYLAKDGHTVVGTVRHASNPDHKNLIEAKKFSNFRVKPLDICDPFAVSELVSKEKPDYFINFAGQSFVAESWNTPEQTQKTNTSGVMNCLEAIRTHRPHCRFYTAGSSEMFGAVEYSPQDEKHPLNPLSPYGASKGAAFLLVKAYRDSYNLFAVNGICFNHESPRRQEHFVTKKIVSAVQRISKAINNAQDFGPLVLGNIHTERDWSHAKDFVKGIWLMLTAEKPKDYILASGEKHTLAEFLHMTFNHVGIHLSETMDYNREPDGWKPLINIFKKSDSGVILVQSSLNFYRPADVTTLLGNSNSIRSELGWKPEFSFKDLVEDMINHE
jgi:GDPmannose 4,6-dehydratase